MVKQNLFSRKPLRGCMDKKNTGISVIVCSRDQASRDRLHSCVADTAGAEFEIIAFDNSDKKWGICKVYNHCAEKAAYPYLCFIHEDVVITTKGWGAALIEFAESAPDCGVVGIAGGTAVHRNFISWNDGWPDRKVRYRFWDPNGKPRPGGALEYSCYNPDDAEFAKAVTIDGCFLFVAQDVFAEKPFNEDVFTGFHFYDADFSLEISRIKQNYVCFKIDIYHYSSGTHNKDFCQSARKFQLKWKNLLPLALDGKKTSLWRELSLASEYIGKCRRSGTFGWIDSFSHTVKLNGYIFLAETVLCLCIRRILRILIMLGILKKREI